MFDFVRNRLYFYLLSAVFLVPGVISLALPGGLNPGIDFTSGLGGGVFTDFGTTLAVRRVVLSHSGADYGGGLFLSGNAAVVDSVFTDDAADFGFGGAIESFSQTLTVSGSTFARNRASAGGAIDTDVHWRTTRLHRRSIPFDAREGIADLYTQGDRPEPADRRLR